MIYNFDDFTFDDYGLEKYEAWWDYCADSNLLLKATPSDCISLAMETVAGYDRETAGNLAQIYGDAFEKVYEVLEQESKSIFLMALAELPEQNGVGTFGNEHYEITVSEFGVTIDLGYVSVVAEGDTAVVYMDGEVVSNPI
jgi:hypothetical protein